MLSEDTLKLIDELALEKGVLKVSLYDTEANFLAEDSVREFTDKDREYGREKIQTLKAISEKYKIANQEISYDLDEMRLTVHFMSSRILLIYSTVDCNMVNLKLSLNKLCRHIQEFSPELPKRVTRKSQSSSLNKASLPDIIEEEQDFVIFLKKQLNKHGCPEATSEVLKYITKHKLTSDNLDSYSAYNLISYLSKFLEEDVQDQFIYESQEVLKQFF